MSTERDFDRIARAWLDVGPNEVAFGAHAIRPSFATRPRSSASMAARSTFVA